MKVKATTDGKKLIPLKTTWEAICSQLSEGCVFDLTIEDEAKESRTTRQNNYFHAIVAWWNKEQQKKYGNLLTPDEAKTCLKLIVKWCDLKEISGPKGKVKIKVEKTTHNLNKEEFNELLTRITDWTVENWGLTPPYWDIN